MNRYIKWAVTGLVCAVILGAFLLSFGAPREANVAESWIEPPAARQVLQQTSGGHSESARDANPSDAPGPKLTADLSASTAEVALLEDAKELERRESLPEPDGQVVLERVVRLKDEHLARSVHVTEHLKPVAPEEAGKDADPNAGMKRQVTFRRMYVADQVLVRLKRGVEKNALQALNARFGAEIEKNLLAPDTYVVKLKAATLDAVSQAVADYQKAAAVVAYAEPNYIVHATETVPNDTRFGELYAMRNTGQTGGTAGADIQATLAWDITKGSSDVLVGVIDTGIDYNHPDLAANIWTNPGEIPGNGVDDDGNGFIDDVHGWDFAYNDNDPMDGRYHGTHCAGTIGGVGGNGQGVTGVCWNVKMAALKFIDDYGAGTADAAINAIYYGTRIGCDLTSNSWSVGGFSQALKDAIDDANAHGVLFVASAGNIGANNDTSPQYPASYASANIIAVAATDHNDALASFSCYGLTSVDLGAPGVNILSCKPGNQYQLLSGTSMATPLVAGVCALVRSLMPNAPVEIWRNQILASTEPIPALSGKCVTGGRLNAFLAVQGLDEPYLTVTDRVLDDSAGDADGLLNPGESIGVGLTVRNLGNGTTYGVQAVLTTADPYLTITPPATMALGDMVSGATVQLQYTVTISPSCPTPHSFAMTLNMTDAAAGDWSAEIGAPIVRASRISVSPTTLSQTLEAGQNASQVVTVANGASAEETLTWNAWVVPPGYDCSDSDTAGGPVYNWIEISGTGTPITGLGNDTNVGPYNIGFVFPFYDTLFSTFRVCSNGWLSFTSSATSIWNTGLPISWAPENLVAFNWDDLNFSTGSAAYYQRIDAQTLVVQFNNVSYFDDSTKKVTCEVLLKADGSILFQYKSAGIANACTVGIQNATRSKGVQVAYNQTYVKAGLAVRLTPQTSWLTVALASGSTPVGGSSPVTASFDATGLAPGNYSTEIRIGSNDPQTPLVVVPVTLTVINHPPIAFAGAVTTDQGIPVGLTLNATDADNDPLTYSIVTGPAHGTLAFGVVPNVLYTPAAGFSGTDHFTFKVNDGTVDSNIATVTITVNHVNTPPTIESGPWVDTNPVVLPNTTLAHVVASDVDGDVLTYTWSKVSGPGTVTFTPNGTTLSDDTMVSFSAAGSYTLQVSVSDGAASTTGTVSVTVTSGNVSTPPVAGYSRWFDASKITGVADGGAVTTWQDLSGNNAHATKPSGNAAPVYVANAGTGTGLGALYFARNSGPSNSAALRFASDSGIRTVFAVFKGSSFLLTAASTYHFHRLGDTNAADPLWEVAHNWSSANIRNGKTYVNGTQVNGTTFAMPTSLHNGFNLVEVVTTGAVTADSFNKDRTFHAGNQYHAEVIIYDRALTDAERIAVENYLNAKWFVGTPNTAPVASNGSATTDQGVAVPVSLNASDADGDALTYAVVAGPTSGTLSGTAPNLTYTPNAGFSGSDSFTFKVNDGQADSNVATVGITVTAPPIVAFAQDAGAQGLVSMEAEHYHEKADATNKAWTKITDTSASGGFAMDSAPDDGVGADKPVVMGYRVNFVKTGTHYIWVRGKAWARTGTRGNADSVNMGLDGAVASTADNISSFGTSYGWSKATMDGPVATIAVTSTGVHTVNVFMREDGFVCDKIIVTTDPNYTPSGTGPAESAQQ